RRVVAAARLRVAFTDERAQRRAVHTARGGRHVADHTDAQVGSPASARASTATHAPPGVALASLADLALWADSAGVAGRSFDLGQLATVTTGNKERERPPDDARARQEPEPVKKEIPSSAAPTTSTPRPTKRPRLPMRAWVLASTASCWRCAALN